MVHPLSPPALLPRGEVKMMKVLFTLVAAGLCICAFGDAATAYYEIVGEHSHLTKAKLFAARSVLARRQAPSPEAHENTTVRDNHKYYTSISKQGPISDYWTDLPQLHARNDRRVTLSSLSNRSRTVSFQRLPFLFPYYGHTLSYIGVTTNGFLYAGHIPVHDSIADFQYIAPLQANFEPSNGSESGIYIFSSDEKFIVQWDKVINVDHLDAGAFTFQVSLFPSGVIHFVYKEIPVSVMNISNDRHPVRVGVSDAFFHALSVFNGFVYGFIQAYHEVDLSVRDVLSNSAIVLSPLPNCIMAQSCLECSNVAQSSDFNCGWCQSLNRCSDGVDRYRQEWHQRGCHQDADLSFCTTPSEVPTDATPPVTTTLPVQSQPAAQTSALRQPGSIVGILIGILVVTTTIVLIFVCVGVAVYGYRHPASRVGMYMIEARKGRFRTNRVDNYDVKNEQLTSEE